MTERIGNITNLSVVRGANPEPDEQTVEMLKQLLERAQTGELRGIVFIGLCHSGEIADGFTDEALADVYAAVGALERIKRDLFAVIDDSEEGGA